MNQKNAASVTRRSFLEKAGIAGLGTASLAATAAAETARARHAASTTTYYATQRVVQEFSFSSGKAYSDPFNQVELDVTFVDAQGKEFRMPAFWAGEQTWKVRFAAPTAGKYSFHTVSSDPANSDLHGQKGEIVVSEYSGANALLKHGPVRVAGDHLHFEHEDGTPFFWLGDTWWMGLCNRLHWPDGFSGAGGRSGAKRVSPWCRSSPACIPTCRRSTRAAPTRRASRGSRIMRASIPAYFDMADLRIAGSRQITVSSPCIVGCWGYFLPLMGVPK